MSRGVEVGADLAEPASVVAAGQRGGDETGHDGAVPVPTTAEQVQALITLYNGTLMTLVVAPPGTVTPEATLALANCLVTGVLEAAPTFGNE